MTLEEKFNSVLLSLFERTGRATGYWPHYFLRSVKENGGLEVARKLLAPGTVSSGFDKLVEAHRADLSVEAVCSSEEFSPLFTPEEIKTAQTRLQGLPADAWPKPTDDQYPDEIKSEYNEGTAKKVLVNIYERDPKARKACLKYHGSSCKVCGIDFGEKYGDIGKGFIHVHHLRPLSGKGAVKNPDPKKDLIPVCPNCHAMLHSQNPPLDWEELQRKISPA